MAEPIRFHLDPLCPWCYQTSRWVRRLEALDEVTIDWAVFSLAIANKGEEGRAAADTGAAPALRTLVLARAEGGAAAAGGFYAAVGAAVHERAARADDREVLIGALREAGLDETLLDRALADPETWQRVQDEHDALVTRHQGFGVPTIVLDGGDGAAIFGPVITEVPEDGEAVELWRHVRWLAAYPNFSELKRNRTSVPDLASVRRWKAAA
ncbi:MAG TPA: DsbA family protein [Candidatus Dormibacteraeota bacterium]|nr:DsbA family protein [Candidatus Dormibacteraeota bacterium]